MIEDEAVREVARDAPVGERQTVDEVDQHAKAEDGQQQISRGFIAPMGRNSDAQAARFGRQSLACCAACVGADVEGLVARSAEVFVLVRTHRNRWELGRHMSRCDEFRRPADYMLCKQQSLARLCWLALMSDFFCTCAIG